MKLENGAGELRGLSELLGIPRKILLHADLDNITEFVLHELCHNDCFQLKKAAYFVDNPDFNYFKGVAGVDRSESIKGPYCIWDETQRFILDMNNSHFNQKVKQVSLQSPRFSKQDESTFLDTLARDLSLANHFYHSWNMRHGNHGFFIYEPEEKFQNEMRDIVEQVACVLGFCPLF